LVLEALLEQEILELLAVAHQVLEDFLLLERMLTQVEVLVVHLVMVANLTIKELLQLQ
jgi:hypothetical protein